MDSENFEDFLKDNFSKEFIEEVNRDYRITKLCGTVAAYLSEQGQLCDDTEPDEYYCRNEDCTYCNMAKALQDFEENE